MQHSPRDHDLTEDLLDPRPDLSSINLASWPPVTPITVRGKFLYQGPEKFFVRGATYGAFPPNPAGDQFPERGEAVRDFTLMRQAGINTILTYTVPPIWLLDELHARGMKAIITTPWMEYVCFLQTAQHRHQVYREVRDGVARCRRHPGVLMYCIGKEIPPPIVRWHGPRKVEGFLRELCDIAHQQDPDHLVTYTNFPTTEYLELGFVDVFTFNVYLHERDRFCAYLSRLQHLAGELPFVLTEFGQCSFRHGREGQAHFIDWQLEEAFDHGLAGAVVFGWTDPFYQDHCLVEEWGFGLVDAARRPKPSYEVVHRHFLSSPSLPRREWPRISVVVAFRNAERTLADCLDSLLELAYPDYEVIMVNDGSTDRSADIMKRYPFVAVTHEKNLGISAGRNSGLRAATGQIVAYIDSDARADADWLTYLACTYLEQGMAGVGGPNPVPPDDAWVAQCVFRAPGGPTQVMLDDVTAEHIPGCNMSFLKSALEAIGGFDEQFTTAADDVDICWRLIDAGYRIGFNASAVVWHHRRPSIRAYWRQQVGYGLSESRLERKFPTKFNGWGHTFWGGRIYGPYPFFRLFGKPVIYQGLWGSAPFQSLYEPGGGGVLTYLPRAMEWHVGLIALLALGLLYTPALIMASAGLLYTVFYCGYCAAGTNVSNIAAVDGPATSWRRLRWRSMLALLNFIEPLARDWGRLKGGLTPWRTAILKPAMRIGRPGRRWHPFGGVAIDWSCEGGPSLEKYSFLERLTTRLTAGHAAVGWNPSTEAWDLKIRRGILGEAFVQMVVEHHGGAKRLARLSGAICFTPWMRKLLATFLTASLLMVITGHPMIAALTGLTGLAAWVAPVREGSRLEAAIQSAADAVTAELDEPRAV
jgi:GT2 family glycosyltransferase